MTGLAVRLCRVGSGDEEIICFSRLSVGEQAAMSDLRSVHRKKT